MLDPLTLSTDLVVVEHELAFAIRTSGGSRVELEQLRAIHVSIGRAVQLSKLYERLLLELPPSEPELVELHGHLVELRERLQREGER